jgi:serine/threonine protein kinase
MQQDDLIGTMLGNYRILAPLGQGGMARVYRAYQENLDREVAIKVLPPWYAADRSFVERFNLEARLVARLSHPNIVTVHDASEQGGHLYIVMQLVDGGTLKQRLDYLQTRSKTMDATEVLSIFVPLADALAYAHEQGIIHRDIKPVNVLMERTRRPILSDFGIAKVLESTAEQLTRPGAGVGTPEYMSPEQCQGGQVDGRADIYALGVLLFEAMTGRPPFQGETYPALAHQHIYTPAPSPRVFNPAINPAFERVILTALEKQPQQRFQNARDMARALEQAHLYTLTSPNTPAYGARDASFPIQQYSPASSGRDIPGAGSVVTQNTPTYACPNCNAPNRPQMRHCTRCGYILNPCPKCGNKNTVSNRFCTQCGTALAS